MRITNFCAAGLVSAACFVSPAFGATLTYNTLVEDVYNGTFTGSGLAVGDAVTVSFDFDQNAPIGTDPTGGVLGFASASNNVQQLPDSFVVTNPIPEVDQLRGTFYQFTNAQVSVPGLGQSYDYGSGYFRLAVIDINPAALGLGVPVSAMSLDFDEGLFSGGLIWASDTPISLDPSGFIPVMSGPLGESYAAFQADAAALGVQVSTGSQFPDLATIGTIDGSVQISGLGGTKPTPPMPPVAAVPLPAPFVMLGVAMLGLAGLGRRRNA